MSNSCTIPIRNTSDSAQDIGLTIVIVNTNHQIVAKGYENVGTMPSEAYTMRLFFLNFGADYGQPTLDGWTYDVYVAGQQAPFASNSVVRGSSD